MAYFVPYVDSTGVHIPLYPDIRDDLISKAKLIFGEDVYLEADAQDYQLISALAEKINDVNEFGVMVYNSFSPSTAIGAALDRAVKINGIRRRAESHSVCYLTIKGDAGTRISGGIVKDENDIRWSIGNVQIPEAGVAEVMATCMTAGPVYAEPKTITRIVTQTKGWLFVTNENNAIPGKGQDTDAELRGLQSISTARPSKTVLTGLKGGIAELPDVIRSEVYENDGPELDEHGIPGHHISVVVEGGDEKEIAQCIYLLKTPGGGTYGDVEINIEQQAASEKDPKPIRFFRPKYIDVCVCIRLKTYTGFVPPTTETIRANIEAYLNALAIGERLTVSALYVPAMAATPNINSPTFSIQDLTIGAGKDALSTDNIEIAFNEVTRGHATNIEIVIEQ